jgi:hypothetical protein
MTLIPSQTNVVELRRLIKNADNNTVYGYNTYLISPWISNLMTDANSTIRKLANLTDTAAFERLVTAVLRAERPRQYANISHLGVNPKGKTIKAPLDGFAWYEDENGEHIVGIEHTTFETNDINTKWLRDLSAVKPRKLGATPTGTDGDLLKAIREIQQLRATNPKLKATIALTSNREPKPETITAANKLASENDITLDILTGSGIAHFLDNDPAGQWIRCTHLGDPIELLSLDLLKSYTRKCLDEHLQLIQRQEEQIVTRQNIIEQRSEHVFLVGASGVGKTTLALQLLSKHYHQGGVGLVLPHETLEVATSINDAIQIELTKMNSYLQPDAGNKAIALGTESLPLMIVVEDLNKANSPVALFNKLGQWIRQNSETGNKWRLICPVWPRYIDALDQQNDKSISALFTFVDVYTAEEAATAIKQQAQVIGHDLSDIAISPIADALAYDPLLIALYDFAESPDPARVVEQYVTKDFKRIVATQNDFTLSEVWDAIDTLIHQMLIHRQLTPQWHKAKSWLGRHSEHLNIIRKVLKSGDAMGLKYINDEDFITTRHDRITQSLAARVISQDLQQPPFETYLTDPFFAEAIAHGLYRCGFDDAKIQWLSTNNPLSLFYTFKLSINFPAAKRLPLVNALKTWVADPENTGLASQTLQFEASKILADVDSSDVISITDNFKAKSNKHYWYQARFRNGDFVAGLKLLMLHELGFDLRGWPALFAHIFAKYGVYFSKKLMKSLESNDLQTSDLTAYLWLAGHLGDPLLGPAITFQWDKTAPNARDLKSFMWAAARCCGDNAAVLLAPICDNWAALSDEQIEAHLVSDRNSFAQYELSFAFNKNLPEDALNYFISRANADEKLSWPITYMMRRLDHPVVVEYQANYFAKNYRLNSDDFFSNRLAIYWDHGEAMSKASKTKLEEIISAPTSDSALTHSAFELYKATITTSDITFLKSIDDTNELYKKALFARAKQGDHSVISQLINIIPTDPRYWWFAARYVWSSAMTTLLEKNIYEYAVKRSHKNKPDNDYILSELLIALDSNTAERILLKCGDNLKNSPSLVQAALYFTTPKLAKLVNKIIINSAEPAKYFEHILYSWGEVIKDQIGITKLGQVKILLDYINYLSESTVLELWVVCNKNNWLDFRREHLDHRVAKHKEHTIDIDINLTKLNQAYSGDAHAGSLCYWAEQCLKSSHSREEIIEALFNWFESHHNAKGFQVIEKVFDSIANRGDIEKLKTIAADLTDVQDNLIDLEFAIKIRTLT